nr:hypothetical protein [Tanacetum cinerariifolium]
NGPTPHTQTTDPAPKGGAVPPPRNKRDEEFTEEENKNELVDIQAINILSQGLPISIFNILNQNETGRENWVNLELLMKGSGQTLERRKEALFDEFERFRANGNELIQDYFSVTKMVQRRASGNMGTKGIQTTGSGVNNSGKKWCHDKALLMKAKEKGVVLDVEAEAFLADVEYTAPYDQPLALTTTNLFEANHEDAYDSDVDEGPHASTAFMANLSSTGGINGSSSSHINEEEHLNSKVDSVLDDNMITYDEYQNDPGVKAVPIVVSADEADKQSMIAVLQRMHTEIAGYVRVNDEHKLINATLTAELERCKIEMKVLERNKVKWYLLNYIYFKP